MNPFDHLDEVGGGPGGVRVRGWALDPDTTASVSAEVLVDGRPAGTLTAAQVRPDIATANPEYGDAHGYETTLALKGHPRVCVHAVNAGPGDPRAEIGCAVATQELPAPPSGVHTMGIATLNIIGNDATRQPPLGWPASASACRRSRRRPGFAGVAVQEVASAEPGRPARVRAGYPCFTSGGTSGVPDLALMSRVPLTDVRRDEGPKPGCVLGLNCGGPVWILTAKVELSGMPVRVITTHLSGDYQNEDGHGLDRSAWRAAQAAFIKDALVAPFGGRVVVVGDFNGNDDLVAPHGPLSDAAVGAAYAVCRARRAPRTAATGSI